MAHRASRIAHRGKVSGCIIKVLSAAATAAKVTGKQKIALTTDETLANIHHYFCFSGGAIQGI